MSQLKKLKKRLTKNQLKHRNEMIGMRSQGMNKKQEKDRFPNVRLKFSNFI